MCAQNARVLKCYSNWNVQESPCLKGLFHTCNRSGQTLGVGVAALTTVVNARCYEVFSSTGKADFAQPHMATGMPETKATMRSRRRQMFVSETEVNILDTEHFGL